MSYVYVTEPDQLNDVYEALYKCPVLAYDTETTGLDFLSDKLRLIQIVGPGTEVYILDYFKLGPKCNELIQRIFDIPAIRLFHNAKFDIKFLWANGLNIDDRIFDTQLAAQLINAGKGGEKYSLKEVALKYLKVSLDKENQTSDWSKNILDEEQLAYAAEDVRILLPLREKLRQILIRLELAQVALLEFQAVAGIASMEFFGMRLNLEKWAALGPVFEGIVADSTQEIIKQLGGIYAQPKFDGTVDYSINLSSSSQLLAKLHELGIPDPNIPGELLTTTNQNVLKLLDPAEYPIIKPLLDYRGATKSLSSFVYSYPESVNKVSGRLHPSYWQLGTDTGRLSCSGPNLQQVPHDPIFRSCFEPAEGFLYSIADYSQIELRLMAFISGDIAMKSEYNKGKEADLHSLTAALVNGMSLAQFRKLDAKTQKLMRQQAKAVNFGFIFCMGAPKFKKYAKAQYGVELTMEQAIKFKKEFFNSYKGIQELHKKIYGEPYVKEARTLSGRLRKWDDPPGPSAIANLPVQGSSADITKKAIADLYSTYSKLGYHPIKSHDIRLNWTVHDEIGIEFKEELREIVEGTHERIMTEAGQHFCTDIPILVDTHIGTSWADK